MLTQKITRPTAIEEGLRRSTRPIRKKIIAAESQGFHIFQAQTANLWLK